MAQIAALVTGDGVVHLLARKVILSLRRELGPGRAVSRTGPDLDNMLELVALATPWSAEAPEAFQAVRRSRIPIPGWRLRGRDEWSIVQALNAIEHAGGAGSKSSPTGWLAPDSYSFCAGGIRSRGCWRRLRCAQDGAPRRGMGRRLGGRSALRDPGGGALIIGLHRWRRDGRGGK